MRLDLPRFHHEVERVLGRANIALHFGRGLHDLNTRTHFFYSKKKAPARAGAVGRTLETGPARDRRRGGHPQITQGGGVHGRRRLLHHDADGLDTSRAPSSRSTVRYTSPPSRATSIAAIAASRSASAITRRFPFVSHGFFSSSYTGQYPVACSHSRMAVAPGLSTGSLLVSTSGPMFENKDGDP